MATLTEVAYHTRRTIKWGGIIILALVVGRWVWNGFLTYWRAKHPPPPPPPTVAFGKLPQVKFPDKALPSLSFRLETISGGTPDLGNKARVFFMPVKRANLLALERATEQAQKLGFTFGSEKITDTRYRWTITSPVFATLEMDIIYGSFVMDVAWEQDPEILGSKNLPNETKAVLEAQEYLSDAGLLGADLKNGRSSVTFWRSSGVDLVPTVSLSEAEFVRVDLFRENLEEGKVVTADAREGLIQVLLSGNQAPKKRIIEVTYNYFPVDYNQSATYPLKTSAQAWEELKAGEGLVVSEHQAGEEIVVRRISLGFFDSLEAQTFLQPVYVFEGDNNFVGYVAAVDDAWVE